MATKEINAKLSYTMLVFLIGIIVLYPSFAEILIKPNSFEWMLLVFVILSLIGLTTSFLGYYLNEFTNNTNHKFVGIGNLTSVLAFLFFVIYFSLNLYQDKTTTPTIKSLTYTPINVTKGENIQLMTTLDDTDNKINGFKWTVDKSIVNVRPNSETGLLHVPLDYSKDSLKVHLTVFTKTLQITDSVTIYLTKHGQPKQITQIHL